MSPLNLIDRQLVRLLHPGGDRLTYHGVTEIDPMTSIVTKVESSEDIPFGR